MRPAARVTYLPGAGRYVIELAQASEGVTAGHLLHSLRAMPQQTKADRFDPVLIVRCDYPSRGEEAEGAHSHQAGGEQHPEAGHTAPHPALPLLLLLMGEQPQSHMQPGCSTALLLLLRVQQGTHLGGRGRAKDGKPAPPPPPAAADACPPIYNGSSPATHSSHTRQVTG